MKNIFVVPSVKRSQTLQTMNVRTPGVLHEQTHAHTSTVAPAHRVPAP